MKLRFEWDEKKAGANLHKHKISFAEAKTVLNDPLLITFPDEAHSEQESRDISIGTSVKGRVLLVVHTEQQEGLETIILRIISSRKATKREREVYEEGEK